MNEQFTLIEFSSHPQQKPRGASFTPHLWALWRRINTWVNGVTSMGLYRDAPSHAAVRVVKVLIHPRVLRLYSKAEILSFDCVPHSNCWWGNCMVSLQWCHNERDGISNHRRLDCLLNRLFRCRSKKTSKPRVTDLCEGNSPVTSEFPQKGPVTRKMFPLDDVFMWNSVQIPTGPFSYSLILSYSHSPSFTLTLSFYVIPTTLIL